MNGERVRFTRDEVVIHNSPDDIWVIVNGLVFDLTNLVQRRSKTMNDVSLRFAVSSWVIRFKWFQSVRWLVQFAGKDLSRGFNEHGEPLHRVNQHIESVPVFPPAYEKETAEADFWWRDPNNIIGKITCVERRIRIVNTLTRKTIFMNVCEEDSIKKIQQKYAEKFNRDAGNYKWRKTTSLDNKSGHLFLDKTLTQNGLIYEKHEKLGLPPALWLFYVLNKAWKFYVTHSADSHLFPFLSASDVAIKKQSNYNFSPSQSITGELMKTKTSKGVWKTSNVQKSEHNVKVSKPIWMPQKVFEARIENEAARQWWTRVERRKTFLGERVEQCLTMSRRISELMGIETKTEMLGLRSHLRLLPYRTWEWINVREISTRDFHWDNRSSREVWLHSSTSCLKDKRKQQITSRQ